MPAPARQAVLLVGLQIQIIFRLSDHGQIRCDSEAASCEGQQQDEGAFCCTDSPAPPESHPATTGICYPRTPGEGLAAPAHCRPHPKRPQDAAMAAPSPISTQPAGAEEKDASVGEKKDERNLKDDETCAIWSKLSKEEQAEYQKPSDDAEESKIAQFRAFLKAKPFQEEAAARSWTSPPTSPPAPAPAPAPAHKPSAEPAGEAVYSASTQSATKLLNKEPETEGAAHVRGTDDGTTGAAEVALSDDEFLPEDIFEAAHPTSYVEPPSPSEVGFQSGLGIRKALIMHWGATVKLWDDGIRDLSDKVKGVQPRTPPPADDGGQPHLAPQDVSHGAAARDDDEPAPAASEEETLTAETDSEPTARQEPSPWSPVVRPLSKAMQGAKAMGEKLADVWDIHDIFDDVKQQRDYWRRRREEKRLLAEAKLSQEAKLKEEAKLAEERACLPSSASMVSDFLQGSACPPPPATPPLGKLAEEGKQDLAKNLAIHYPVEPAQGDAFNSSFMDAGVSLEGDAGEGGEAIVDEGGEAVVDEAAAAMSAAATRTGVAGRPEALELTPRQAAGNGRRRQRVRTQEPSDPAKIAVPLPMVET